MEENIARRRGPSPELIKSTMTQDDWRRVARTDQIELMRAADRWLDEPFAAELLLLVAQKEPLLIFQQFEDIQTHIPEAKAILQASAERASEIDPGIIFFYFPLIQETAYSSKVLTRAAERCIELRRTSALEFAQNYLTHSEAEGILSRTAEQFPTQAIYFYRNYQGHQLADRVLGAAVGLDPKAAIVHANRYAEAKEAKQLLKEAIAKEPETAQIYRERYEGFLE